jgi:hypothetical protein
MPTGPLIKEMLLRIVLPALVLTSCISFLVPRRLIVAAAIWLSLFVCNFFNFYLPRWWPEALGWEALIPILFAAMLLINVLTISKTHTLRATLYRAAAVGLLAAVFLVESDWSWVDRIVLALLSASVQLVLEVVEQQMPAWLLAGLLACTSLAASLTAIAGHAAKPADICLGMAACWGGLAFTAVRKRLDLRIAFALAALTLPTMLLTSRVYNAGFSEPGLPWISVLLVALSPITALLAYLPERYANSPRLQFTALSILWLSLLLMGVSFAQLFTKS